MNKNIIIALLALITMLLCALAGYQLRKCDKGKATVSIDPVLIIKKDSLEKVSIQLAQSVDILIDSVEVLRDRLNERRVSSKKEVKESPCPELEHVLINEEQGCDSVINSQAEAIVDQAKIISIKDSLNEISKSQSLSDSALINNLSLDVLNAKKKSKRKNRVIVIIGTIAAMLLGEALMK